MALTLVRHTRPAWDAGVCYGRTDIGVASSFPDDARAVIRRLTAPDRLVSSPLLRCRALAERIGAAFNLRPAFDDRLQELDFGAWEGRRWKEIARAELDAWATDVLHACPHGGESVARMAVRVGEALADLRAREGSCVVVTHAGVIRIASGRRWDANIPYGATCHL